MTKAGSPHVTFSETQRQDGLFSITTMFAPARRRCAQCATRASIQPSESTPAFLLPAFARSSAYRSFTTTSPCRSKIGSAPLSVPQGVTFTILPPSTKNKGPRTQAMSTVQIKGPLGELSMDIPNYVNIDQDPKLLGPTLTIEDSTDAKQKAMWGILAYSLSACSSNMCSRDNPRIPPKPHPRRERRPQRDSALCRSWLSCLGGRDRNDRDIRIPRSEVHQSQSRLLSPSRARHTEGRHRQHTATDASTVGRAGEGGSHAVCGKYQSVEDTGAIQGQGNICERRDYKAEEQEDQVDGLIIAVYTCMDIQIMSKKTLWEAGSTYCDYARQRFTLSSDPKKPVNVATQDSA